MKRLGGCYAARSRFKVPDDVSCCGSCHYDLDEYGYGMCTFEPDEKSFDFYEVCCEVSKHLNDHQPEDEHSKPDQQKEGGVTIIADPSVPEDEFQFRHPDGRLDKFKLTKKGGGG